MSEFQDFLKRRFAYVAVGEFKSGKFEEAQRLYEQAIATYGEGFQGSYLLQEPGTDRGIAIIFWEGAAEMEANHSQAYDEILKKMMPLFASHPQTSFCEVVCDMQPTEEAV
jgi:hypothetical protein